MLIQTRHLVFVFNVPKKDDRPSGMQSVGIRKIREEDVLHLAVIDYVEGAYDPCVTTSTYELNVPKTLANVLRELGSLRRDVEALKNRKRRRKNPDGVVAPEAEAPVQQGAESSTGTTASGPESRTDYHRVQPEPVPGITQRIRSQKSPPPVEP